MLNIHIDIDDDQVKKAFQKAPKAIHRQLKKAVARGAEEVARDARKLAPKAFSTLTQSIRSTVESDLARIVGPHVDYGQYVEQGSDPGGAPSLQTLIDWIRVKRIQPKNSNNDERDLAFMIRRSIARTGIKAQPYMEPAADNKRNRVSQLMDLAVSNGLREAGLV